MNFSVFARALTVGGLALLTLAGCHKTDTSTSAGPEKGVKKINEYWSELNRIPAGQDRRQTAMPNSPYRLLRLDMGLLKKQLATPADSARKVVLPLADGSNAVFLVTPARVMSKELAARYPGIGAFKGTAVSNPATQVRFEINANGFKAMVNQGSDVLVIDPYQPNDTLHYLSYTRNRATRTTNGTLSPTSTEPATPVVNHE